jgi:hypothetical protein
MSPFTERMTWAVDGGDCHQSGLGGGCAATGQPCESVATLTGARVASGRACWCVSRIYGCTDADCSVRRTRVCLRIEFCAAAQSRTCMRVALFLHLLIWKRSGWLVALVSYTLLFPIMSLQCVLPAVLAGMFLIVVRAHQLV